MFCLQYLFKVYLNVAGIHYENTRKWSFHRCYGNTLIGFHFGLWGILCYVMLWLFVKRHSQ